MKKVLLLKRQNMMNLLKKVNSIDTSRLVNKTDFNIRIKDTEQKIPDITKLATTVVLNVKIDEVKNEIANITCLSTSTTTTLTAVNKIPDVGEKANYDTKIGEIEKKLDQDHGSTYIATEEPNSLTSGNFTASSKEENLASKYDIADLVEK